MKKVQREVYIVLSSEIDGCLCSFCKHAEWSGCCSDSEVECQHPLYKHTNYIRFEETCCPGEDCWGFRPVYRVRDIADIVGVVLAEGFTDWSFSYSISRGRIIVYGRKADVEKE